MGDVFPFCMWVRVCVFSGYGKGKGRRRSAFSFFCYQRRAVVWNRPQKSTKKDNTGCTFRFHHFSGLSYCSQSNLIIIQICGKRPSYHTAGITNYSPVLSYPWDSPPYVRFHKPKRMLFTSCEWCSPFDASSMYVNALSLFLRKEYHVLQQKSSINA